MEPRPALGAPADLPRAELGRRSSVEGRSYPIEADETAHWLDAKLALLHVQDAIGESVHELDVLLDKKNG